MRAEGFSAKKLESQRKNSFSSPIILCILKYTMGQVILFKYEVPSSLGLLAPTGLLSILHCLSPRALPWLENVCRLNCHLLSKGSWPLGIPSRILEDREVNQNRDNSSDKRWWWLVPGDDEDGYGENRAYWGLLTGFAFVKHERKEECPSFGLSNWKEKVTLVERGNSGGKTGLARMTGIWF